MKRAIALVLTATTFALAACTGAGRTLSGPSRAGEATSSPFASTGPTEPAESPEPIGLDGHILLSLDTFYVANADGSDPRLLADPATYCCQARISPDHSRILTMPGTDETGSVRGGTLAIDGSRFKLLAHRGDGLNLVPQAWSPDGTRIAFEGWDDGDPSRTGVYTARASDGGDLVRVTTSAGRPHDMPLDYSPDGTQLVFHRAVRAEPHPPIDLGGSLWVVNADGSNPHRLDTGRLAPWWQARWSPDGSRIVFSVERLQPSGALWTIEPDGSGLTKLFQDPAGGFAVGPIWSPDGRMIMFSLNQSNDAFNHLDNAIYVINSDGTGETLVLGGPGYKGVADWWDEGHAG